MTLGFGPSDVHRTAREVLGPVLAAAGFEARPDQESTWASSAAAALASGGARLTVKVLVMEHPDDAPHGQSFTLDLIDARGGASRMGLLLSAEQMARVRDREQVVLRSLPPNDVTAYRIGVLTSLGEDVHARDQWLTAGSTHDVRAWLDLLVPWLPDWAAGLGVDDDTVSALREAAPRPSPSQDGATTR